MDLIRCTCGCDKLSKDELERVIKLTDKVIDFLNNPEAVEMFTRMLVEKKERKEVGCNVLQYLNWISMASEFIKNPSNLADENGSPQTFTGMIDEDLSFELLDCTDDESRKKVLGEIIKFYSTKISLSSQYKEFQEKLMKAYKGKEKIARPGAD